MRAHNPFRFDRLPTEETFVNRTKEIRRIVACMQSGENLLVYGLRRMGKTSCLQRAARIAVKESPRALCFFADMSRYTSLGSAAQTILTHAATALDSFGNKAQRTLLEIANGLAHGLVIQMANTGDMPFAIAFQRPPCSQVDNVEAFVATILALEQLAVKQAQRVTLILDEFTFIEKLGGPQALWQIRSVMQSCQKVTFIFSGSAHHAIAQLTSEDGPLLGMFSRLEIGPIDPSELGPWIDAQFAATSKFPSEGIGASCIALAGPRTRDTIQLARRAWDMHTAEQTEALIQEACSSLIDDLDTEFSRLWHQLSLPSQAVLKAIAAGHETDLFHGSVRKAFGLGSTATITQTTRLLTRHASPKIDFRDPILTRHDSPQQIRHTFDNPFFRIWIRRLPQ